MSAAPAHPHPAPSLSPSELAELVADFNVATDRLQATHEALREEVFRLRSELSVAKRQLRRARQLAQLGEVAAGIAHEVRNPLGSMKLYAGALIDDLEDRPEQQGVAKRIDGAIDALDAIVCDVLTLSRDREAARDEHPARDIVDRAEQACGEVLVRTGTRIEVSPETNTTAIWCDRPMVEQAIANLIRNACEVMEEAGTPAEERSVRISASRRSLRDPDGAARPMDVLRIEDHGPGIAPEAIERAFNPFYTTRDTGTGLGLAIVHRIVDAHGGRVDIYNNCDREAGAPGASVEVAIPERQDTEDSIDQEQAA
jgi:signal transduction histidine kinase